VNGGGEENLQFSKQFETHKAERGQGVICGERSNEGKRVGMEQKGDHQEYKLPPWKPKGHKLDKRTFHASTSALNSAARSGRKKKTEL